MKVNYHTHTYRCRHAEGTDREYVEAAIAAGIKVVGFSDHAPIPFADGFVSSSRMAMDELEGYVNSIRSLQQEYKSDIRILLGYEAEYYPDEFASMIAHLEQYGYDFLILGQHYLGREQDGRAVGNCGDDQSLQDYVDQVLAGLETGKFLYLAHPDMINYQGPEENMFNALVTICQKLKELNMPVEYNLLGARDNRHYPTTTLLRAAKAVGNSIILGADAHQPHVFARKQDVDAARKLIEGYGLTIINEPLI
ncbi:MAG: histidinol-phosphatase [Firmicutes bacterium]|nr:histidinol-phosphatase [Bacillota bacterium]